MARASQSEKLKSIITSGTFFKGKRTKPAKGAPPIFAPFFSRDFSLGIMEIWYAGEKSDPRQWTQQMQPIHPYLICWRKNGMMNVYMDQRGLDWIKQELQSHIDRDPQYVQKVVKESNHRIQEIKPTYEREPALSLKELERYTEKFRHSWPWFEAVWWLIDLFEEKKRNGRELDLLLTARKEGEKEAPSSDAVIRKSILKAYPKLKKYVPVLLLKEVFSGKIPSKKELDARFDEFFFTDDTLFTGFSPSQIEKELNVHFEKEEGKEKVSDLKGQVAFPGVVRGKVRKVFGRKDLAVFQEGEIIVSPSTTPDFMPALVKAIGIITDEGGIVSHAAIISRELGIPCVVGTKNATRFLKNGDLVEVDANTGIVRKVK
jgi:phosphohistidine swiveling domain-containing protein